MKMRDGKREKWVLGDDFKERREGSNEVAFGGCRWNDFEKLVFNRTDSSFFHLRNWGNGEFNELKEKEIF